MSEGTRSDGVRPDLSVVVPVFDEADSVEELLGRIREALGADAEVLFVDDGSRDATRSVLTRLAEKDPRLRVLSFRRNYGKSQALAAAFRRARGSLIATLDGDLQDDPAEIPALVARLAGGADGELDVVVGWRRKRNDAFIKVFGSRAFNWVVSRLTGVRLRDINSGIKVFRREVLEGMVLVGGFHRFLPVLAHWRGYRVGELPVEHRPRQHGKSRYGPTRILRALMDLAVILFLVRFDARPGRLFVALGALQVAGGVGVSIYIAVLRLATGTISFKYPLLALGLALLIVGFQFLSVGMLGELLAYHFRSQQPFEPVVIEGDDP